MSRFFQENYLTDGMKQLRLGLRRLASKSNQGLFLLSQTSAGAKSCSSPSLSPFVLHGDVCCEGLFILLREKWRLIFEDLLSTSSMHSRATIFYSFNSKPSVSRSMSLSATGVCPF